MFSFSYGKALTALGEKDRRIAIFDLSISIQNRESGKIKRDGDLQKPGKIAVQNRHFDLDLQHWYIPVYD